MCESLNLYCTRNISKIPKYVPDDFFVAIFALAERLQTFATLPTCILKNIPFCSTIAFANLRSRHQQLLAFKAMHLMVQHLFDLILVLLVLPILRSGGQSSHVHQLANIYGVGVGVRFF